MDSFGDRANSFCEWLLENGAFVCNKVRLKEVDGMGTGMVALDAIEKDKVLFMIPKLLLLSRHYNPLVKSRVKNQQWNQLIWTIILEIRNNGSFFKKYFDMIPSSVNTARSWSMNEKDWLKGTDIYEDISDCNPLADFRKASKKILSEPGITVPTEAEFCFAADLISSYSFTEPKSGEVMMVPMADMLNHSYASNAHCEYLENGEMAMVATRHIERGEQVFNTFGETGNSQLLLKYGFIEQPNPETYMIIYGNEVEEYCEGLNLDMSKVYKLLKPSYKVSFECSEMEKLFAKLKIPSADFYVWRRAKLIRTECEPVNERLRLAHSLRKEQCEILSKHINRISQS
jgi:SET domain-containing protein 6